MKNLRVTMVGLLSLAQMAIGQTIDIGSFDGSRSRAPFATASGSLGYGQLRGSLLNPANFGLGGAVRCPVAIASPTSEITPAYLADKEVFFTSVFTGLLTAGEVAAIHSFVENGGVVIVDGNSDPDEQAAANSLLAALGTAASMGSTMACVNLMGSTGGQVTADNNEVTNGPFGDVRGEDFGVTSTAVIAPVGAAVLTTCDDTGQPGRGLFPAGSLAPQSGLVMFGGDPSAVDLFTSPTGSFFYYQPNNEKMYLNAVASACRVLEVSIDIKPGGVQNFINCKSRGELRVAILSTPDFQAPARVDRTSLTFGATGDEASLGFCSPNPVDVNRDGLLDLVCNFEIPLAGLCEADETTEGVLKGRTTEGISIIGRDSVRLVPR